MNNKLEKLLKEAAVAGLKVLSKHFSGDTEEKHEKLSQVNPPSGR
jgi:hypothetical protein